MSKRFLARILLVATVVGSIVVGRGSAQAAVITTAGSQLNVSSVPTPTIGSQGYVFYATDGDGATIGSGTHVFTGGSAATPVNYVNISTGTDLFFGGTPTTTMLTINGVPTETGVAFQPAVNAGTLATITLTGANAGDPVADFILGVLVDNITANNSMVSLTVTGANPATQLVAGNTPIKNDFYFFQVSGGLVGETITLSGVAQPTHQINFGGLTFDAVPEPEIVIIPEPSSIALLILGSALLGLMRARRISSRAE